MSADEKQLPPLPVRTKEGQTHGKDNVLHNRNKRIPHNLNDHILKLMEENEGLYGDLRQRDDMILYLTRQIEALRSSIKQQQESFTRVFQHIRSAFEQYRDTMPVDDEEGDSQDSQKGGGFSDSDNDYI
ncbi:hypothetical protein CFAM422_011329 [Trichoderma lentiforme]|uniref:Uncharacterized protein n=1 Tax=Trichoderma lentiforme TaxID=1567552 RepID=A0A9P4X6N0_9HYPO|nr:hypothetical protein CFAM422_011329 [Trichoderma lentiforme]